MRPPPRSPLAAWLVIIASVGFLIWADVRRAQRVIQVSAIDAGAAVVDPKSPTGYADGKRWLIVPEHDNRSYQWIAETQQMLARGESRLRRIDYENAPFGREVHAPSLYRWWLVLVARCDHAASGRPLGLSVERAALWADPVLHLLLLLGTALFAGRCFGLRLAAVLTLGLATLYPLASAFLPGVPDNYGFAQACALWSVLPLLAGILSRSRDPTAALPRWFFLGGVAGGVGLWNSLANELPVLGGLALGGLLAIWLGPRPKNAASPGTAAAWPWRVWALGGALASFAGYLAEYFPANLALHLQVNHPLHGLAWLGVGELLALASLSRQLGAAIRTRRNLFALLLAIAAVAALPLTFALTDSGALLAGDPLATRLTHLTNGAVAKNFATWLVRDGLNFPLLATVLPLLALPPALWLLCDRRTAAATRAALALALGPVLVCLGAACAYLRWWSTFDAAWLALVVAGAAALPVWPAAVRYFATGFGAIAVAGLIALAPSRGNVERDGFSRLELQSLLERDLAHAIADRAGPGGATILCPPDKTPILTFHGGLRGLGTPNWENRDGLAATARIVSATTADEAQALLAERHVTYLVLPSWDTELDEFVAWTLSRPENSILHALHKWALPPWLRLVPHPLPHIPGFEDQSVTILEVTDNSDRATALSWLTEAALEAQQPELAAAGSDALQAYPANLGALIARATVEKQRENSAAFAKLFEAIESGIKAGQDRRLPWERRVSLAVILAQGDRPELARPQVERCLREVDAAKLRSLTTGSLYRLLVLAKTYGLEISNPAQHALALGLLPSELRQRL